MIVTSDMGDNSLRGRAEEFIDSNWLAIPIGPSPCIAVAEDQLNRALAEWLQEKESDEVERITQAMVMFALTELADVAKRIMKLREQGFDLAAVEMAEIIVRKAQL